MSSKMRRRYKSAALYRARNPETNSPSVVAKEFFTRQIESHFPELTISDKRLMVENAMAVRAALIAAHPELFRRPK